MRKHFTLVICVAISGMIFSSCRPATESVTLSCAELLATPLQPFIGQVLVSDDFVRAAANAYGISPQAVSLQTVEETDWKVSWTYKGYRYTAWTEHGGIINRIVVELHNPRVVTAGHLIDCMGSEPEWYSAHYGMEAPRPGVTYHFVLYFPRQGIVVTSENYVERNEQPPLLAADSPMDDVVIGSSGSLADLYERRWGFSIETGNPAWKPIPWPGRWRAVHWLEDR